MKYPFLFSLLLSLAACSNTSTDATSAPEEAASESMIPTADEISASRFSPGTEVCQLYSTDKVSSLLGCNSDLNKKIDNRDNSYGCTFICTDPFVTFAVSAVWTKDGSKQNVSRRDDNPALEKVSIPGADAAHFVEAQGRLMIAKGKYLMTVQIAPSDREAIFKVAEEVLAEL